MSRTDKDMPFWASAEYYEPWHAWRCVNSQSRYGDRPCTLPERVVRQHPQYKRTHRLCTWEPDWSERRSYRYRYTWGPRKTDRHLDWYGPDRAKVRDQMTKAKHQYNGSGDVEIVERVQHHHHASIKGWWD